MTTHSVWQLVVFEHGKVVHLWKGTYQPKYPVRSKTSCGKNGQLSLFVAETHLHYLTCKRCLVKIK